MTTLKQFQPHYITVTIQEVTSKYLLQTETNSKSSIYVAHVKIYCENKEINWLKQKAAEMGYIKTSRFVLLSMKVEKLWNTYLAGGLLSSLRKI